MGKKTDDVDQIIEEIVDDARSNMNLRERLLGITRREKTVRVYTDEETGEALGGAEDLLIPGTTFKSGDRRRWGVLGDLDLLNERAEQLATQIENGEITEDDAAPEIEKIEARMPELRTEARKLLAKLNKTSFAFTLRAVPELIIKDARRQAKHNLEIKGKVPEGRLDEFNEELYNVLIASAVTSWVDNETGSTHHSLSVEDTRTFRELLPRSEFPKLVEAFDELSAQAHIARSATDDVDF